MSSSYRELDFEWSSLWSLVGVKAKTGGASRLRGKVCEGCGGEEQGAGRALEGVGDGSEAEGCGGLPKKAGIES